MIKTHIITNDLELKAIKNKEYYTFKCKSCGKIESKKKVKSYKSRPKEYLLCKECSYKKTCIEKYGVSNVSYNADVRRKISEARLNLSEEEKNKITKKIKITKAKNHNGNPNWYNKEKCKNTWKNKSDDEIKMIRLKTAKTNMSRYGGISPICSKIIQEKCKITKAKNHNGNKFYNNRSKAKSTMMKKYGAESYAQTKEYKDRLNNLSEEEKNKITNKRFETLKLNFGDNWKEILSAKSKNYWNSLSDEEKEKRLSKQVLSFKSNPNYSGVDWVFKDPKVKLKIKDTMIKKYGARNYTQTKEYKNYMIKMYNSLSPRFVYNYYGIRFDSSWELAVWIYCIDHNIPIIRNIITFHFLDIKGKVHNYIPDFLINKKLVEIKGDLFFKEDGTMYFPYTKKKINGKWVPLTSGEKEYMNDLYERKHQCGLTNGVEFWKESDCLKYIEYCDTKYPGWNTLYRKDNPYNPSYWCLTINNPGYYQRMYFVPKYINTTNNNRGVTPFDCNNKAQYTDITSKGLTPFDV